MKNLFPTLTVSALVLFALGGTSSAAGVYTQNFDGFADGTTNLGDGSVMAGTANIQNNALELTRDGVAGGFASFSVPALQRSTNGFIATFDLIVTDSPGANEPADGLSFNYGNASLGTLGAAEEGMAGIGGVTENLSFEIDTWMNLDAEQGVNIAQIAGGIDTDLAFTNGPILLDGTTRTSLVVAIWDPVDGATFITNGLATNAFFLNEATSFTAADSHNFILSARVGGANQTTLIDNLVIRTIPEPTGFALIALSGVGLLLRRRR